MKVKRSLTYFKVPRACPWVSKKDDKVGNGNMKTGVKGLLKRGKMGEAFGKVKSRAEGMDSSEWA